jgi:hypothetical protein
VPAYLSGPDPEIHVPPSPSFDCEVRIARERPATAPFRRAAATAD